MVVLHVIGHAMTIATATCAFLSLADSVPVFRSLRTKAPSCVWKRRHTTLDATRAGAYHVGLLLLFAMLSALDTCMSVRHRFHKVDAQVVAGNATRTILICGAYSLNVSADMFLGMLMNSSSWTHRRELKAQYLTFPR